jgi:very-short-patch-repair endonuclease
MKKKTLEEFKKESKKIHGDKYDYSLVEYVSNSVKVNIICPIHGSFMKRPTKHVNGGQGCPKCVSEELGNKQRKTIDKFVSESKKIHGDKYDYSLVEYVTNRTKVNIICPVHGEFEQTPGNHLKGKGCRYCGGTSKMDTNQFIHKAKLIHGDKYDYKNTKYVNSQTKVNITCPVHGEFEQTPNNHLSKNQGCYTCLGKCDNTNCFIENSNSIHGDKYDYTLVNYINNNTKVKIICPIHGEFEQTPNSHTSGCGCPKCGNGLSKSEGELSDYITSLGVDVKTRDRVLLGDKELDIVIPSKKITFEFNGLHWHSEQYLDKDYHLDKTERCESIGYTLIHIFEDEWVDKKEIVKSRVKNLLGFSNKIYGRKCVVGVVNSKDKKQFLEVNHIQGDCRSTINLGLYHKGELVSLMTFGKRPILNSHEWELIRFCNKLDTSVVGGASKLLKYFKVNHQPKEIVSYADRRWSQGKLYDNLGFTFVGNTKPNYFYLINKKRENRFKYQKHKLVLDGFDVNESEHTIMLGRGIYRIYDCGNKKYIYNNLL